MSEPTLTQLSEAICEVSPDDPFAALKTELRVWRGITYHHSMIPAVPVWRVDYAKAFNNFHYRHNRWSLGLGYHLIVTWDPECKRRFRCQASYRWVHQLDGAHTQNIKGTLVDNKPFTPNCMTIGICLVGDFEHQTPTPESYDFLARLTRSIMNKSAFRPAYLFRHDTFKEKICPGKNFELRKILSRI